MRGYLAGIFACVLACLGAIVWTGNTLLTRNAIVRAPLPLAGAQDFDLKWRAVEAAQTFDVILLGDSLGVGRTMQRELPFSWRNVTLDRALASCLPDKVDGRPVAVWNFALDGGLPNDFQVLSDQFQADVADLVLYNVNLRSFSNDFTTPETKFSRSWIEALNEEGGLNVAFVNPASIPDLLKAAVFDNNALEWTGRILRWILAGAGIIDVPLRQALDRELLLKLRARYRTIETDPVSPQVAALAVLAQQPNRLGFHTAEEPNVSTRLLRPEMRAQHLSALDTVHKENGGAGLLAAPPLERTRFLDAVHVDPQGYDLYARRICQELSSRDLIDDP